MTRWIEKRKNQMLVLYLTLLLFAALTAVAYFAGLPVTTKLFAGTTVLFLLALWVRSERP